MGIAYIIFLCFLAKLFVSVLGGSKSKCYRKYLCNLYVAGRIRQFAEEDDVDLAKEDIECMKYVSKSYKYRIKDLDGKIEAELMEKIEKKVEEKAEKKAK